MVSSARKSSVGNLPARMDEFVGRHQELADIRHAMETSRLVTLVGPGGVGKTRLALQVAADFQRAFPQGVWFVDVALLQDPELLAPTVASVLELSTKSSSWGPWQLGQQLADRSMVLILDNCEHLIEATAKLADALLRSGPRMKILATSRRPLEVRGEHLRALRPLRVPVEGRDADLDELKRSDAVRLFLDRAAAVEPGFALTAENASAVAELCRQLDGLPLALELAAARIRHLSPQQILDRFDRRFELLRTGSALAAPRQRSLHSLIAWSYDLCTREERELWTRLTVFSGTFSAPAAEAVCSGTIVAQEDILDLLARLVDRSIVTTVRQSSEVRYSMLGTIRAFGREHLAGGEEEVRLRRRHRDYFRNRLTSHYPLWFGPGQHETMAWVRSERDNLRAAIDFCLAEPMDTRSTAAIASGLGGEALLTGRLGEGRHWIGRVLSVVDEDCVERAILLWLAGECAELQGDFEMAEGFLRRAQQTATVIGARHEETMATIFLGVLRMSLGAFGEAVELFDRALGSIVGDDPLACALLLMNKGKAVHHLGNGPAGIRMCREAVAVCEHHGEYWHRAQALWQLANLRWHDRETDEAAELAAESLRLQRAFRNSVGIARCVETLAWIAEERNEHSRAARLLGCADALWRATDALLDPQSVDHHQRCRDLAMLGLGERAFKREFETGVRAPVTEGIAFALRETAPPSTRISGVKDVRLTPREWEIADLLSRGASNRDIASKLVISPRTVEGHVVNLLSKLGFSSRVQVAVWMAEHGDDRDPLNPGI
ncbi:LuxR C-terminal-related transcriptional regulator [Nocardia sp. CA2R105]|uniref:ATP-binding protein n=1 Tax=Nocardia coffeae TaxID=2873381 RepID=UPI001CA64F0D|nr:LuxR C-terminal-related transcriptional regulator [Nocardia coffeae]MBY8862894.1 LuxR C-terminal-related transcriptional regulator [Nocardia coffeae]